MLCLKMIFTLPFWSSFYLSHKQKYVFRHLVTNSFILPFSPNVLRNGTAASRWRQMRSHVSHVPWTGLHILYPLSLQKKVWLGKSVLKCLRHFIARTGVVGEGLLRHSKIDTVLRLLPCRQMNRSRHWRSIHNTMQLSHCYNWNLTTCFSIKKHWNIHGWFKLLKGWD